MLTYLSSPASPSVGAPRIGALLRLAWLQGSGSVLAALHAAGFRDLSHAHYPVLQYPGPDGVRPTVLAQRAHMTKQAMHQLLTSLERLGYLTRGLDPRDRRARVIRLTERGRAAMLVTNQAADELERQWAERLGTARFEQLRACLRELANQPDGEGPR